MSILDLNDRGFAAVTGAKRPKLFNFEYTPLILRDFAYGRCT